MIEEEVSKEMDKSSEIQGRKRVGHCWRKVLRPYSKPRLRNPLVKEKGNIFLCIRKEGREGNWRS